MRTVGSSCLRDQEGSSVYWRRRGIRVFLLLSGWRTCSSIAPGPRRTITANSSWYFHLCRCFRFWGWDRIVRSGHGLSRCGAFGSQARGLKKHLKRLNAPKHWMLDKLGGAFVSSSFTWNCTFDEELTFGDRNLNSLFELRFYDSSSQNLKARRSFPNRRGVLQTGRRKSTD